MDRPRLLFVTGMMRSGTTLLQRLMDAHPEMSVLYQPLMPLFTCVKNAFLLSKGYRVERYPLGTLFAETMYRPEELGSFLQDFHPDNCSWQGKQKFSIRADEHDFARILSRFIIDLSKNRTAMVFGSKEVLCEEFAPYLISQGFFVIIIIRDPRDVLVSMNYGQGEKFAGHVRPTLYNLRNWRKSVAVALNLTGIGSAAVIRYEDLVDNPLKVLNRTISPLGLSRFSPDFLSNNLTDEKGQTWTGNSSFGKQQGVSVDSVGRFKQLLPESLVRYVETVCRPEMKVLGYRFQYDEKEKPADVLKNFCEPLAVSHDALPEGYSTDRKNIESELERIDLLADKEKPKNAKEYFIFENVWELLHNSISIYGNM